MRQRSITLAGGATVAFGVLVVSACGLDVSGTLGADLADATTGPDATAEDGAVDRAAPPDDGEAEGGAADDGIADVAPRPDATGDAPGDAPGDGPSDAPIEASGPCTLGDGGAGLLCGGTCIDPGRDHEHCGGCGPCAPWAACEAASCVDVAAALQGFRYEQPCNNGQRPFCATGLAGTKTATLTGTPNQLYAILVRVRGVVEQKTILGGSPGTAVGANASFFVIGGTPALDNWNIFSMDVASPPYTMFFNSGASLHTYVDGPDYTATMKVSAGTVLTFRADPRDGYEAPNLDQSSTPIVVPGIAPAPASFDGQFLQLDVTSARTYP